MPSQQEIKTMAGEDKGGGSDLDIFEGLGKAKTGPQAVPEAPPPPPPSSMRTPVASPVLMPTSTPTAVPALAAQPASAPAIPAARPSTKDLAKRTMMGVAPPSLQSSPGAAPRPAQPTPPPPAPASASPMSELPPTARQSTRPSGSMPAVPSTGAPAPATAPLGVASPSRPPSSRPMQAALAAPAAPAAPASQRPTQAASPSNRPSGSLPAVAPPPRSSSAPEPAATRPAPYTQAGSANMQAAAATTKPGLQMDWDDDDEATHVFDEKNKPEGDRDSEAPTGPVARPSDPSQPTAVAKRPSGSMPATTRTSAPPPPPQSGRARTSTPPPVPSSGRTPSARPVAPPAPRVSSAPPPPPSIRTMNAGPAAPPTSQPPAPPPNGGFASTLASAPPPSGLMAPPPPPPPPMTAPGGFRAPPSNPPPPPASGGLGAGAALARASGQSSYTPPPPPGIPGLGSAPPPPAPMGMGHHSSMPPSMPPQVHTAPMAMPSYPPTPVINQGQMYSSRMEQTALVRPPPSRTGLFIGIALSLVVASVIIVVLFLVPHTSKVAVNVTDAKGAAVNHVEIFLDGKKQCDTSPCLIDAVSSGSHAVKVLPDGADPQERTFTVSKKEEKLDFSVATAAATGLKVAAGVSQPGVKLYVDGREIGPLPQELKDLAPGDHKVRVAGTERYEAMDKSVTVAKDEMLDLGSVTLRVVKGKATITLGTPGAKVLLVSGSDKRDLKDLPISLEIDTTKTWTLEASKAGFNDYRQPISFSDGQAEKVFNVELEPKGSASASTSTSAASGSSGSSSSSSHASSSHASASTAADKGGDKSASSSSSGGAEKATAPASGGDTSASGSGGDKAAAPPAGEAFLNINSMPASSVVLDGKPIGNTPKLKISVGPGQHTVVFVNAEQSLKKVVQVTVGAGETKPVIGRLRD